MLFIAAASPSFGGVAIRHVAYFLFVDEVFTLSHNGPMARRM